MNMPAMKTEAVTALPATAAPVGSVTVPVIVAVLIWADARKAKLVKRIKAAREALT